VKNNYYIALFILFSWACANKVQPTGGPKDKDPPIVISSIPTSGQRNFHEQNIIIEFNEYIKVDGLKEQLLITPRIEGDYSYKIKKRTISLEFEEPLADSTTYTLNFREGIVDITENNPAKNLLLAFSTGDMLDTLEISGMAVDLFTKKPIEGAIFGLYTIDDTLDIFTGPPYYLTKTNKKGEYHFKNLKDGTYRIYAFIDGNKNFTCQSNQESYGFLPNPIKLDTAFIADTLTFQHLNIDTLKILRTKPSGKYFLLTANKYLTDAHLQTKNDSSLYYKYTDDREGLKIYNTFLIHDSLQVFSTLQDSLGSIAKDTFYIHFPKSSRKYDEFKFSVKEPVASVKRKIIAGEIVFDKPLKNIFLDSISIKRDSIEQYFIKEQFTYVFDSIENKLNYTIKIPQTVIDSLNRKKDPKIAMGKGKKKKTMHASYALDFPPGSFTSVENDTSQQLSKKIKFIVPEQIGLLNGNITSAYDSYFIQLLKKDYKLVQEQYGGKSYSFEEIEPGEYYIRILIDENGNGKWDPGNIRLNQLPEKVILYKDENGTSKTSIRANWEITIDLIF
jgi:hypothetical protein